MTDSLRDRLQTSLGASYTIERELGGGGMARVYVAREEALGRLVVVKVLAPEMAEGLSVERFAREVRLAAALQEPHIVPVLTAGVTPDGLPYYTMPYVRGASLRHRLASEPLPAAEAVLVLIDVATALEYAHGEGVVHRDIKPENILLSGRTAVVTDFGIAKALDASRVPERDGSLTTVGVALGTPAYMAPEQAAGDPSTDHRTDIYAWGMLAYELLAGRHPFADKATPQALLVAQFVEQPAPLSGVRADLPGALTSIVMQCLEKDPDRRPNGAGELLAVLRPAAVAADAGATAPSRPLVPAAPRALAVLPFENLSPDPENAFFADGLTEEVITDLARVRALRVIAHSSVMHYRGSAKAPREVGRELGAGYLLTGSVRRHGPALRVSARLVDVDGDVQVWADRFSGTVEDVFEIQERIARDIVAALAVRLSPEEDRRLAARSIRNAAAYELYLRARQSDFVFDQRTIREALRLLDQADAIEGESAPLLAARALLVWNEFNMRMRGDDAYAEARALADRALALDPALAPALVARAMLEYGAERMDAALMLRLLQRAVDEERAPAALTWLSVMLGQVGRPDLAMRYASLAQQLDPLSPINFGAAAFPLLFSGSINEAVAVGVTMLRHLPEHHVLRFLVGAFLTSGARHAEAARTLEPCAPEGVYGTLAELLRRALAGDEAGVAELEMDERLREAARRDDQYCWHLAQALALVGRHDAALEWLRRGAERAFVNARFVGEIDASLAPLRAHPGFQPLLDHMRRRAAEIALAARL